ncbi:diguanylate cyclase, partial [Streptomyces fradiae]
PLPGPGPGARLPDPVEVRGFHPRAVRRAGRHLGLVSMRDRAGGVGGRLTVHSAPGAGTTIEMEVPGG